MRPHATICIVGMTVAGEARLEFREHPEPSMTIGDLQEMRRAKKRMSSRDHGTEGRERS